MPPLFVGRLDWSHFTNLVIFRCNIFQKQNTVTPELRRPCVKNVPSLFEKLAHTASIYNNKCWKQYCLGIAIAQEGEKQLDLLMNLIAISLRIETVLQTWDLALGVDEESLIMLQSLLWTLQWCMYPADRRPDKPFGCSPHSLQAFAVWLPVRRSSSGKTAQVRKL